jgi:hypothetical protein
MDAELKKKRVFKRTLQTYAARKSPNPVRTVAPVESKSVNIPAWVLDDRDRRRALAQLAPAFGDPLPGYSELDKRRK